MGVEILAVNVQPLTEEIKRIIESTALRTYAEEDEYVTQEEVAASFRRLINENKELIFSVLNLEPNKMEKE